MMVRRKQQDSMRIAMLGHKRIPSREGGVEIVVEELSSRMAALGHSVVCYNRKGRHVSGASFDEKVSGDEYRGVRLKSVWTVDKRGLAAMTASVSAAVCASFGSYDVVHFHAEGPCAMLWLPKLFGKRCIATIHGLDHKRSKWGAAASRYILFGEKCAAKLADEIIVLNQNTRQYFKDTYGRNAVYIPNGIERPVIVEAEEITEKYGLHKEGYILFLGRLVPEKGIKYLIEAFKSVDTDKKLVIAGGASDTADFENELKACAAEDSRILFTGFVQGRVLDELFGNAYIYVLPSDVEGMPISLLEAMSYGNCCLTSDIPDCADVTDNVGFTFKAGDIEDLCEKLKFLCDSPEKVKECKEKSAAEVLNKYNWDDVVGRTLRLYGAEKGVVAASAEEQTDESLVSK